MQNAKKTTSVIILIMSSYQFHKGKANPLFLTTEVRHFGVIYF